MLADFTRLHGVVSQNITLFEKNLYSVKYFSVDHYLCEEQNTAPWSVISTMFIRFTIINLYLKFGRHDKLLMQNQRGEFRREMP
jgi:hypothetical protein